MDAGGHDPELAERTLRELAAVTDAELADDIRAAAAEVFAAMDAWRGSADWSAGGLERRLLATVTAASEALAVLPADAGLDDVTVAVRPILGQYWPSRPAPAAAAEDAVERLRHAAIRRPQFVRDARRIVARESEPG